MGYPHKIVTCCYCGTRAALVLRGESRHELTCSSCGAPLHDLKMLPKTRGRQIERDDRPAAKPSRRTCAKPVRKKVKPRNRKKKRLLNKVFKETFDFLEDIFD